MKRTALAAAALVAFSLPALSAETAAEISAKHATAKATALEAYLKANPEAADIADAEDLLLDAYDELGAEDKMLPLLKKSYARVPADQLQQKMGMAGALIEMISGAEGKDAAKAFAAEAAGDFKDHPKADAIAQHLNGMASKLMVGDNLEIAFTDTAGKEFDLGKMEGKIVLVDFWATWCGPCVGEMPNVISAYQKYNGKGFEVVGISLDQDRAKLDGFIADRKMPWPQYFDGKGWGNDIAKQYGITGIPATYLVKDGKILATNLRGSALAEAIEEQLAE